MGFDIEQKGSNRRSYLAYPDSTPSTIFPDEHQRKMDLDSPKFSTAVNSPTGEQKKFKGDDNDPSPSFPPTLNSTVIL